MVRGDQGWCFYGATRAFNARKEGSATSGTSAFPSETWERGGTGATGINGNEGEEDGEQLRGRGGEWGGWEEWALCGGEGDCALGLEGFRVAKGERLQFPRIPSYGRTRQPQRHHTKTEEAEADSGAGMHCGRGDRAASLLGGAARVLAMASAAGGGGGARFDCKRGL